MIGGDGDDGTSSTTLNQGRQHQQHSGGDAAATARSRSTSSSAATSRVQGDAAARADVRRFGVEVHEEFFFWAKLMSLDEAPLDKLQYPSLSPIPPSQRRDYRGARDGWQCLYPERNVRPPLVTLMD
jgi:hypothetical protein